MSAAEERFWPKVDRSGGPDACWLWTACIAKNTGYGLFKVGRLVGAHRYSYQLTHGAIPEGLLVLHRCDVRNCVNPKHLFVGTYQDNSLDTVSKKRNRPPPRALTAEQVAQVRARHIKRHPVHGQSAMAREFGVAQKTIWRAVSSP